MPDRVIMVRESTFKEKLEALRGLANALEVAPGPRGVMDLVPGALEKARAAIAKAEGRS